MGLNIQFENGTFFEQSLCQTEFLFWSKRENGKFATNLRQIDEIIMFLANL
jgi:hypothetical protein